MKMIRGYVWITAFLSMTMTSISFADKIDIKREYIEQMNYKISYPMPCNWDPSKTTIFGYYGNLPSMEDTALSEIGQKGEDIKKQLFQLDLILPTAEPFGQNFNLEFTPEMMQHEGMPLQIVEIDYKPLNKRCEAGFSPGLLTR